MKVLIISDLSVGALSNSLIRAYRKIGVEVVGYDLNQELKKYAKFGKIGHKLHAFLPVDPWIRKANRELAVFFKNSRPDTVIVVGNAPVLYSTLAFWKSISNANLILFWPDMLTNLEQNQLNSAALYDQVATYSFATVPVFNKLNFQNVTWVPFAGDLEFLGKPNDFEGPFEFDLSFIGGWRPERERAVSAVVNNFPELKIQIRGFYWKENCKNKNILKNLVPGALFGKDFGDFFRKSRINLNVIDDTNFPSANMRFFEIPASGGLQLCSCCPEMEGDFVDKQHILYFKDGTEFLAKIDWVISHPERASALRKQGHELIIAHHTYESRIRGLVHTLNPK